jgi:hypothetical protein
MKFKIGDRVIAQRGAPYSITTNGWRGRVVEISKYTDDNIFVKGRNGECFWVGAQYFDLFDEKEGEIKMDVSNIITEEERETLLDQMKNLLDEYGYEYTDRALNKIIDTWANNKKDLITAFKKHPNYLEGKFMIVFSHDFERVTDCNALERFKSWVIDADVVEYVKENNFMPENMKKETSLYRQKYPTKIFDFLIKIPVYTFQYIDSELADELNKICPEVHAHDGQKTSRVINKLLTYIGVSKHPDYNREFAKYADALNPLTITRHTVLSVNPLDYLTMSFGNSWASCHTIDKRNKRGMPNSYAGMYSSGTISYMLDSPSMVFYTVDASYNGNDFWNEPKINRQMFHWGEEKLVQGRLYPQDNDGDNSVYTPYREIVQKVMSELFSLPNYWTVSKGTDAAGKFINSDGTHYRDYDNYSNCTLSRPKGSENDRYITVGHDPICIECGHEHDTEDCISCCSKPSEYYCEECGEPIDDDDVIWINDRPYCCDCVTWCDECESYFVGEGTAVIKYGYTITVCDDCFDRYAYCNCCGEYHPSEMTYWIDADCESVCDDCFSDYYGTCEDCGEHYKLKDLEDHNGNLLCPSCLEDAIEKESEMEEAV